MTQTVHSFFAKVLLVIFTVAASCFAQAQAGSAPELVFRSAVLKSGTANKEGAVYRFSSVTSGVDAEIKLKKFSRNDILMRTVDNSVLGWDKAFQPEFGLQGLVAPNQNWYVDFEMTFFEAGTNKKKKVQQAAFTALDVDGDGVSVAEYAVFEQPSSITFSTVTNLMNSAAGSIGQSLPCGTCSVASPLSICSTCNGTGVKNGDDCTACGGSGAFHSQCGHPFQGIIGNILQGPVTNFSNIDTSATQVMATYQYQNKDRILFRYGAKSGSVSSNGAGIRLNSLWGKSFSLTPWSTLPVSFTSFSAQYQNGVALLQWQAAHDEALDYFLVQRSTNGKEFTDVATVFAGSSVAYAFKDKNCDAAAGVVYYRLVAVDQTKETKLSDVRLIRLNKTAEGVLAIEAFPNPVVNEFHLAWPAAWQGKAVVVNVYNAAGSLLKTFQTANAGQSQNFTAGSLPKGHLLLKAVCGTETATTHLLKN